jgi:hypothetical protein
VQLYHSAWPAYCSAIVKSTCHVQHVWNACADMALGCRLLLRTAHGFCPFRYHNDCSTQLVVAMLIICASSIDLLVSFLTGMLPTGTLCPCVSRRTAHVISEGTMMLCEATILASTIYMATHGMALMLSGHESNGLNQEAYSDVRAYAFLCRCAMPQHRRCADHRVLVCTSFLYFSTSVQSLHHPEYIRCADGVNTVHV